MNGFIITIVTLASLLAAPARAEWVRYQDYKIKIDAPKNWKIETDLYGVPITALGPERSGERAVVLVQHTSVALKKFEEKDLEEQQKEYVVARKEWLAKADDATFIAALPAKYRAKKQLSGFEFAYQYRLREHNFEEHSLQLSCAGQVYLVKTLTSEKNPKEDLSALAKIMDGFDCSNTTAKDGAYVSSALHQIQDLIKASQLEQWPGIQDFKNADSAHKAQSIEALVEFYKRYDDASVDDQPGDENAGRSKANLLFKNFAEHVLKLFPQADADADEPYNCFFGGWPSHLIEKKGATHLTCDYPKNKNAEYAKYESKCSTGEMACNPALFGADLCVNVEQASMRRHATLECELKLKASGKTYETVTQEKAFDEKLLNETIESAKDVCNNTDYVSTNYGLCNTLKEKLQISIAQKKHTKVGTDETFAKKLEQMKPEKLEALLAEVNAGWEPFQKECVDENGHINGDDLSCVSRQQKFLEDFQQIEKAKLAAKSDANPNGSASNANCDQGNCGDQSPEAVPAPEGSCSAKETARMKDPALKCQWSNASWVMHGPLNNVFKSFLADLWGTVTGIFDLGVSALKGVGHLIHSAFADDQLANKAHQDSQAGDSLLASFKKHPVDTAIAMFQSLVDQTVKFIDEDVYCQHWTGQAHFSHCDLPANRTCLSCTDRINGYASMIGYAVGEAAPFLLSGGMVSLAKKSDMVLKMGELLAKSTRTGRFLKLAIEAQSRLPSLAKLKPGLIEKISIATRAAEEVDVVKASLKVLEKWSSKFKSFFGNVGDTIEALKDKSKVVRASAWVGRTGLKVTGKTVGFVASLPSLPGELLFKTGLKTMDRYVDKQILTTIEKETMREVASGSVAGSARYVSPISGEMPLRTANTAKRAKQYADDITATEDLETRPGFIGRAFKNKKDKLPDVVSKPIDSFFDYRTRKKQAKFETLLDKQSKRLKDLKLETDPVKFAQLSPEERLDQIRRAKKFGVYDEFRLNRNGEKIEKAVAKSGTKVELPSREEVHFNTTYLRRVLATSPAAKYMEPLEKAKADANTKINTGSNEKDLEMIARQKNKSVEDVKKEEIEQKDLTPKVQVIIDKVFYGGKMDAGDVELLKKAQMTPEKVNDGVKNMYVIESGCILQTAMSKHQTPQFDAGQAARKKSLGKTDEQILSAVEELAQQPGFGCP